MFATPNESTWLFPLIASARVCVPFVQFSVKEEADRCLAAAIGATDPAHARDSGGSCIYLGSRALHVTRAVDREQVSAGAERIDSTKLTGIRYR